MSKQKRLTLKQEAFNWAFSESGSKAKTEKGRENAVSEWLRVNAVAVHRCAYPNWFIRITITTLEESYLNYLHAYAQYKMDSDLAHRSKIVEERKRIKQYPVYTRYYATTITEVKKTYKKKAGNFLLPAWIEHKLENLAYHDVFDGSRCRKTYIGDNVSDSPGWRTEDNGKPGWKRVVWHYADYTAIAKDGRIAYRCSDNEEFEIFYHFKDRFKARGKIYTKPAIKKIDKSLSPHHLRRFFNIAIPENSPVKWIWDVEEKAGYYLYGEEKYHTVSIPEKSSREYLHEAVRAFKRRKREKLETARAERVFKNLDRVYVSIEDSIASGNCKTQTERMRDELASELHAEGDFAIRADYLWEKRSDNYARRAILKASEHTRI